MLNPGSLPAAQSKTEEGEKAPADSYVAATIQLRDGKRLRGALKHESRFDAQLMGLDGHLHLLSKDQIASITREPQSLMPKLQATPAQIRDLVAYLSRLRGAATEASLLPSLELGAGVPFANVAHPKPGEWPSYNGNIGGNRFSPLAEINTSNIAQLAPRWSFTMPGVRRALENTPQVVDGVMYVTGSNEAFALDARTGRVLWHYARPRTKDLVPTGDAIAGINRGVAVLGDRVFMVTDNARLIALHRYTGKLIWDVGDGGLPSELWRHQRAAGGRRSGDFRHFRRRRRRARLSLDAYKASTGERVWRFWTVPAPGEPGSETWVGTSIEHPGAATWLTGTYDPEADMLYWAIGNPGPDYNGDSARATISIPVR